jgi:hypothetical protein
MKVQVIGVGWMRNKPPHGEFTMYANEQPDGGFEWTFLDYEPEDSENWQKIYISIPYEDTDRKEK